MHTDQAPDQADEPLGGTCQPLVLVDCSQFTPDGAQQLLRASLPVGGRAITLYEELHPQALLGNRAVQQCFLEKLRALLPSECTPIIIADAGFKVPFFRSMWRSSDGTGWGAFVAATSCVGKALRANG